MVIDHINGDTLDCRRENLRPCIKAYSACNAPPYRKGKTSRYKGVSYHEGVKKWWARISLPGWRYDPAQAGRNLEDFE